jgi:hypothetical protein
MDFPYSLKTTGVWCPDGKIYNGMSKTELISMLEENEPEHWLQKDDTMCHISNKKISFFRDFFWLVISKDM